MSLEGLPWTDPWNHIQPEEEGSAGLQLIPLSSTHDCGAGENKEVGGILSDSPRAPGFPKVHFFFRCKPEEEWEKSQQIGLG